MLIPYNLPPWMCLKQPFWIMSMFIPGLKSPGNDIDVYLQPLIYELKQLWEHGVETYDVSLEHNLRQFYGQSMTSPHMQCCLDGAQKEKLHVHLVIRIHGLLGSSMDESIVIWVIVDF